MWYEMWIGFGILFWLLGFLRAGYTRERGNLLNKVYVRPPQVIYLVCGLPKASNLPHGVMAVLALMVQLQGILFIVYGIICYFWRDRNFALDGFLLLIGTILICSFSWQLYKRDPYTVE